MSAEADAGRHPVPHLERIDALADRLDLAGDLVPQHARRFGRIRVEPHPGHGLREVDASRLDRDADLARPWLRVGPLLDLEDLRPTHTGLHHGSHARTLPTERRRGR